MKPGLRSALLMIVPLVALIGVVGPCHADDPKDSKGSYGAELNESAKMSDIGLPLYPGARVQRDRSGDSPALTMGLWLPGGSFRLVIVKLATDDKLTSVADFYRNAMSHYGAVLDCSDPGSRSDADRKGHKKELSCGDDKPDPGGQLYKVGTPGDQRIFAVSQHGQEVRFHLVHLVLPLD